MTAVSFLDPRLPDRFWEKCIPEPNSGCWLWLGSSLPPWGYGRLTYRNQSDLAHRVAYAELVAPIPDGLEIDHCCKNPTCCNPAHLEAVTHLVNVQRSDSGKHNAVKTHCSNGHEYTRENTRTRIRRGRQCRVCIACHVQWCRDYRARAGS